MTTDTLPPPDQTTQASAQNDKPIFKGSPDSFIQSVQVIKPNNLTRRRDSEFGNYGNAVRVRINRNAGDLKSLDKSIDSAGVRGISIDGLGEPELIYTIPVVTYEKRPKESRETASTNTAFLSDEYDPVEANFVPSTRQRDQVIDAIEKSIPNEELPDFKDFRTRINSPSGNSEGAALG